MTQLAIDLPEDVFSAPRLAPREFANEMWIVDCRRRPFFDGISGAAITMKYNQMNAELLQNKKLRDKIAYLKKQLLNI